MDDHGGDCGADRGDLGVFVMLKITTVEELGCSKESRMKIGWKVAGWIIGPLVWEILRILLGLIAFMAILGLILWAAGGLPAGS